MQKRQANIEFARIVACFIVVCIHTITWYTAGDRLLENSLLIRCFLTDGVPIFWYIMGYFLFANPNTSHIRRAKKTLTSLVLPAFCVMIFSQIWKDWILADLGEVNFFSCLDMHSFDSDNLFGNILTWKSDMTFGGHFWYIFSYIQVLLWAPLLGFICEDNPKANHIRWYLMLLCALYIINKDISNLAVLTIGGNKYPITVYSVITPTLLYILIGYETYRNQNWIKERASWLKWWAISGFVCFNLLKYFLTVRDMRIDISDSYFLGISTVSGYLASYSLFIAIYCLKVKPDSRIERTVLHLASKTLGIYLIHGCIFRKLKAIGIRSIFYMWYTRHPDNLLVEIICTVSYAAIVFLTCYLILLILQAIKQLFRKCTTWMRSQIAQKSSLHV